MSLENNIFELILYQKKENFHILFKH